MGFLSRLWGARDERDSLTPLYTAIIARAREPHWYLEGAVADTLDGRFDMVAAILSLTLMRLEAEPEGLPASTLLTEVFIDDMDGQLRQIGIGDIVVGKKIGHMMGVLGGRLGAYRTALRQDGDFAAALTRNLYRGTTPDADALAHVETRLRALDGALARTALADLLEGGLPDA